MTSGVLLKKLFFTTLLVFTSLNTQAQTSTEVILNNLRITNRAQCALDSSVPTESAFVVVDGYNAGKLGNTLAKNLGVNPDVMSAKAMQDFRISVARLTRVIANKVFSGALPLLPLNLKTSSLKKYNALAEICSKKTYCPELNSYLTKLWENSEGAGVPWEKIDNFTGNNFLKLKNKDRVACFYVKKFSGLQEQLHEVDVNQATLQEIAQAVLDKDKYITNCEDTDPSLNSRNSILQLDFKVGNSDAFAKSGFDFWNSVKIYLSFAWRYSNIPSQVTPELGELFKSIALEESIMMIPNGCKSIEKPECDSETLSLNSIRELAKPGSAKSGVTPEPGKEVPQGPDQDVIAHGVRGVNDDFLGTRSYENASEWVDNFRKNYVQVRGSMKNRVQSAIQLLNIISTSMTAQTLTEYIKPLAFAKSFTPQHRDELYYMCTETRLAGDQRIDFMRSGIDKIKNLDVMQKAFEGSKKSLPELSGFFDSMATGVVPLCDALERQNIWNVPNYQVNRSGFSPWARELLNIPPSATIAGEMKPMSFGAPLLVWDSSKGVDNGNVICMSGIDCARKAVKAMVDLYAVAKYADAYLPVSSTVATPGVFNPYAELKACKIYDPWFETRRANKRLFVDLASTALFGWNFLPLYLDVDFTAPKVTSLNQLIKNGTVKFDPKIQKEKMETSLLADFGPLMGAPCAISIAPNSAKAFNFYAIKGISVNYCNVKSDGTAIGNAQGDVENTRPASQSYCGGCSINLVGVASGAASAVASNGLSFNPIKLGVYLFRAFNRFLTAKEDKVNIPLTHQVNLNNVAAAYKKYGKIPDYCVEQLAQGFACYHTLCEARAAEFFERFTGAKVQVASETEIGADNQDGFAASSNVVKSIFLKTNFCDGNVAITMNCADPARMTSSQHDGGFYGMTQECRDKLGQNFWGF